MHEDSNPCISVHSPATYPIPTADDPDDETNPVGTGHENTQCSSRTLGAGVGEAIQVPTTRPVALATSFSVL